MSPRKALRRIPLPDSLSSALVHPPDDGSPLNATHVPPLIVAYLHPCLCLSTLPSPPAPALVPLAPLDRPRLPHGTGLPPFSLPFVDSATPGAAAAAAGLVWRDQDCPACVVFLPAPFRWLAVAPRAALLGSSHPLDIEALPSTNPMPFRWATTATGKRGRASPPSGAFSATRVRLVKRHFHAP